MSAVAIAVDAARDAAHRAHTDAAEAYTRRWEQICAETQAEIRSADPKLLGELLWSYLDGIGPDSRLELLDEVFAACRELVAAEYSGEAPRRLAMTRVINAYHLAEASAVCRRVDARIAEDE